MISYTKFSGYEAWKYRHNFSRLANMSMLAKTILTCAWSPIVWKNNNALTDNFEFSDFMVLDFDMPGDETMAQINNSLSDHKRIIATTRSHGISKQGIICDRFRLIVPWSKRITCYKTYRQNYERVLAKYHWADKSCVDGARFFFPSKEIVYIDRDSEYTWDTFDYVPPTIIEEKKTYGTRIIPSWCLNFINHGMVSCGSRNGKVWAVALELFREGFSEQEIRALIRRAPIDWVGVNLESAIKSAKKRTMNGSDC